MSHPMELMLGLYKTLKDHRTRGFGATDCEVCTYTFAPERRVSCTSSSCLGGKNFMESSITTNSNFCQYLCGHTFPLTPVNPFWLLALPNCLLIFAKNMLKHFLCLLGGFFRYNAGMNNVSRSLHGPRILVCGNYGATNIGDEAILESILQFCKKAFLTGASGAGAGVAAHTGAGAHVTIVSADPLRTSTRYGLESVAKIPSGFRSFFKAILGGGLWKTLRAYRNADAVIFGGGGLFTDEKPHAILIWMMQILPAFWYKKPVMCLGQSVGPLMSPWSRWVVKKIFRKMRIVTVRDEASRSLLEKMGVHGVHVLPDPVFGLEGADGGGFGIGLPRRGGDGGVQRVVRAHSHDAGIGQTRKPYIVFSLRPWIKNAEDIRQILAEFVDWMFETYHLKTYFVPFQSARDDDENESLQVLLKLGHHGACEVLPHNENIPDVLKLMREATAVIGMRLHSLIFSAITHTPFLALSYSLKVAEVVKQLGMEDFLNEYRFVDPEVLRKQFEKLFTERAHVEKALAEKHRELAKRTEGYELLLRELLR